MAVVRYHAGRPNGDRGDLKQHRDLRPGNPGITGGALDSDEAAPGPLMLQGDHGPIDYRNIVITAGTERPLVAIATRGSRLASRAGWRIRRTRDSRLARHKRLAMSD